MKSHKIIVIGVFYACLLVLFVLILFVVVFIKSCLQEVENVSDSIADESIRTAK